MYRSEGEFSHPRATSLTVWDATVKSIFDRIVAAGTLVVLAPVFLLCWAYVKCVSPRTPAVVTSPRVGLGGRVFSLRNFHTAVDRRWSAPMLEHGLIHIPELINVVRGEMALVGPRPRPLAGDRSGRGAEPEAVALRPGMTGLWMLTPRTELTPQDIHSLDRTYVESWSLSRDIRILTFTAAAVGSGRKTA